MKTKSYLRNCLLILLVLLGLTATSGMLAQDDYPRRGDRITFVGRVHGAMPRKDKRTGRLIGYDAVIQENDDPNSFGCNCGIPLSVAQAAFGDSLGDQPLSPAIEGKWLRVTVYKWGTIGTKGDFFGTVDAIKPTRDRSSLTNGERALTIVQDFWDDHTTTCGDSTYAKVVYNYAFPDAPCNNCSIEQYKNVSISLTDTYELSEVDRMNGIEWNGKVSIRYQFMRRFSRKWSDWMDNNRRGYDIGVRVTKRNGVWDFNKVATITYLQSLGSCSEAPL